MSKNSKKNNVKEKTEKKGQKLKQIEVKDKKMSH